MAGPPARPPELRTTGYYIRGWHCLRCDEAGEFVGGAAVVHACPYRGAPSLMVWNATVHVVIEHLTVWWKPWTWGRVRRSVHPVRQDAKS